MMARVPLIFLDATQRFYVLLFVFFLSRVFCTVRHITVCIPVKNIYIVQTVHLSKSVFGSSIVQEALNN